MKRLSRVFNALFFLSLSVWFLFVLHHDTTHPETWCDWKHDPRWSAPAAVVVVPLLVWMYLVGEREWRRDKRDARLLSMILIVKELSKPDGARRLIELTRFIIVSKRPLANGRRTALAKQFSDLYHT